MKKIKTTIIIGAQRSGKTTKVLQISEGKNRFFVDNGLDGFPLEIQDMPENTECIIIEGVKSSDFTHIEKLITVKILIIRPLYKVRKEIERPEFIFTTCDEKFKEMSDPDLEIIVL